VRVLPSPPEVPGDPDQIQQVCLNLLMNAIHAMPSGGTLRITAERVTRRKEGLDLASPTPYAMLEIADTGPGIPPENRGKIFEPFFTTKDEGQGTGLGLAVSHGIVKDHDGWIEVDGQPGGGAVFRVFLPCAAGGTMVAVAGALAAREREREGEGEGEGDRDVPLAEADRMGKD
jgi:signal transduction histidine kinase